jgi:hypothetical protein
VGSTDGKCDHLYRAVWKTVCGGVREVGEVMKKGKIVYICGPGEGCYVVLEPGKGPYTHSGYALSCLVEWVRSCLYPKIIPFPLFVLFA